MDLRRALVEKSLSVQKSRNTSRSASRQASRHGSVHATDDEYETDDNLSVTSCDSVDTDSYVEASFSPENALLECLQSLGEYRGSRREDRLAHLTTMQKLLTTHDLRAICRQQVNTLLNLLVRQLKTNVHEKESILAMQLAVIVYVNLPDNHDVYQTLRPPLERLLDHNSVYVKAAVLSALSFFAVIDNTYQQASELAELLLEVIENDGITIGAENDTYLIASATSALTLVLTIFAEHTIRLTDCRNIAACFAGLLSQTDFAVRIAAGEGLALCCEILSRHCELPLSQAIGLDLDHLKSLLSSLSTTSSKKLSKQHRREQHNVFRDVLAAIVEPTIYNGPTETIKLRSTRTLLEITSWSQSIRLQCIRFFLGAGLLLYLSTDTVVRRILQSDKPGNTFLDDANMLSDDLSKDIRNTFKQELRKQRHRVRMTERKDKNAMHDFYTASED